ncbi:glycosyltransferase family 9 protein [Nocardia blacklockiae]|uniref:glycosyltransferase family 9 protein n=1 Tax=Nocardia blacklockiae TaxID=480036 RepID=UPI00189449CD|nr:glycosyltransferase family 9 protein [Nocardia blacklockiae]MBF6175324.1 glycosyltransferase family 9 protein [Nocardia blacklockiae]
MAVILVLRALGVGDLLTAVPALRALRRAHPGDRIVLAAPAALAPLAALTGAVDAVHPTPGLGATDLPTHPALAVNLHGRGPQSIADLTATHPNHLLTHHHPAYPAVPGPNWVEDIHEVDRWCRLLQHNGINTDPTDLFLDPPNSDNGHNRHASLSDADRAGDWADTVVVHPGAGAPARRWPPERYAAVSAHLRESGRRVVITGSAAEREGALAIADAAGVPAGHVLAGVLDLAETASLVAAAALVVCGDTGIGHLATAVRTPSVLLFGPTPPQWWGPPAGLAHRHRVLWSGTRGDPLGAATDPGLLRLTVDEVVAAVDTQLASTAREFGHVG